MCRRGVLPMDGSAYRRLDRVDTVVVDAAALCTGPPVVLDATAPRADGWDAAAVWTAATRLLDGDPGAAGNGAALRLGPPADDAGRAGRRGAHRCSRAAAASARSPSPAELDPHAEALLDRRRRRRPPAGADPARRRPRDRRRPPTRWPPPTSRWSDTVRRLQADGHGVLVVSAADGPALLAADVAVAPVLAGRAPAWGADLVTAARPGRRLPARRRHRRTPAAVSRRVGRHRAHRQRARRAARRRRQRPLRPAEGDDAGQDGDRHRDDSTAPGPPSAPPAAPRPRPSVHTPWHALEPDDVLHRLADLPGRAEQRRAGRRRPPLRAPAALAAVVRVPARFARTVAAELADPLTPVLATGAAATAVLGKSTDAILVGSVTVDQRADQRPAAAARGDRAGVAAARAGQSRARRETDGRLRGGARRGAPGRRRASSSRPATSLAADARLLEVEDLEVDESGLTGESLSVGKSVPATPGADVADRTCMLFDGTTVVAGRGRAVVVAVGQATQAGRAARAAGGAAPPAGVQARLGELTRAVLPLTLAGGGVVTAARRAVGPAAARGGRPRAWPIAVAAVPEGLPLVATVAQQAAARRLSRRGAVVRSARVLEALGRVDTVCFDKTGTLTENRLQRGPARRRRGRRRGRRCCGWPPRPWPTGTTARTRPTAPSLEAAADAGCRRRRRPTRACPSPPAAASPPRSATAGWSSRARPRSCSRRCADAAGRARAGAGAGAGSGLRVLAVADRAVDGRARRPGRRRRRADAARAGRAGRHAARVVGRRGRAAAGRRRPGGRGHRRPPGDGRARSPPRPGSPTPTGWSPAPSWPGPRTPSGPSWCARAAVFARLSPEQKVTLVAALRRAGATLAMTGDGVNDAAAIRLADVGVGVVRGGVTGRAHRGRPGAHRRSTSPGWSTPSPRAGRCGPGSATRCRVLVGGNAGEVAFTVLGTAVRRPVAAGHPAAAAGQPAHRHVPGAGRRRARAAGGVDEDVDEGPLAGHPLAAVLLAGPQRGFTDAVRRMVLVRGAATTVGATGAWAAGRLTGRCPAGPARWAWPR